MKVSKISSARPIVSMVPRWRVLCGDVVAVGPGKADLLEEIARLGSLAKAAREMKMSYMRAWLLIQEMNRCFQKPLVAMERGGSHGGGAALTPDGQTILALYRKMEKSSAQSVARDWEKLRGLLQKNMGPEAA